MDGWLVALLGSVVGAVGASLTFITAMRLHSGRVATTDADKLWEQNNKLIETLGKDNHDLRERLRDMENRERELVQRVHRSELAEQEASARAERLERELTALKGALSEAGRTTT